jgi:hypothetical protein
MDNILELIVDDKFKYNIKRSIMIKNMKQYDLSELKIKQKDGCFEIYMKKNGTNKNIKKVYEFTTYKKDKKYKRKLENSKENMNDSNDITPILKKLRIF